MSYRITLILTCLFFIMAPTKTMASDISQIKCLADNAYFEARGQSVPGQIAVMFVVINRTKDYRFAKTPCQVIGQKGQFSWFRKAKKIHESARYDEILILARKVYTGQIHDNTNGAVYFHNRNVKMACKSSKKIDSQVFCR